MPSVSLRPPVDFVQSFVSVLLLTAAVPPVDTLMREMRFDPQMAAVFERMSDAQAASLVENWTRVVSQVPENDVRALKVCEI